MLARYPSENCLTTPHLCSNGFTLAFYAKMGVTPEVKLSLSDVRALKVSSVKLREGYVLVVSVSLSVQGLGGPNTMGVTSQVKSETI